MKVPHHPKYDRRDGQGCEVSAVSDRLHSTHSVAGPCLYCAPCDLFGFEARAKGSWCGRRDLNPHGPCGPTDFHTRLRLSPPPTAFAMEFGVWTIPSPCPDLAPGVRCCPSSLYTFPASFSQAWLGIAMLQGSPNLSSSAPPVSRRALKFALKSDASADSATPAQFQT